VGADDLRDPPSLVGPFPEDRGQGGIRVVGPSVLGRRGLELGGEPPKVLERLATALDRPQAQCDRLDLGRAVGTPGAGHA
jgi:hypothetical protein